MATAFDRDSLLEVFDEIGSAAVVAETKLQIAVYGGSALMLASNFCFATEDVDIAEIGGDWPEWLRDVAERIAVERGWAHDWLNDGVAVHLSALATPAADHLEFGTFPRDGSPAGLFVSVPTAEYLLALKLKAMRVTDPVRGEAERLDILNLMDVVGIESADQAVAVLGKYFPVSGASAEKRRFLLKNMTLEGKAMRPNTLADAVARISAGAARDATLAEFIDSFDGASTPAERYATIVDEPAAGHDPKLDALVGAMAEYLAKQHRLGHVPAWVSGPGRRLAQPWFTADGATNGMREYLTFSSPAEFASRNIFTEERPLRRARSKLVR